MKESKQLGTFTFLIIFFFLFPLCAAIIIAVHYTSWSVWSLIGGVLLQPNITWFYLRACERTDGLRMGNPKSLVARWVTTILCISAVWLSKNTVILISESGIVCSTIVLSILWLLSGIIDLAYWMKRTFKRIKQRNNPC